MFFDNSSSLTYHFCKSSLFRKFSIRLKKFNKILKRLILNTVKRQVYIKHKLDKLLFKLFLCGMWFDFYFSCNLDTILAVLINNIFDSSSLQRFSWLLTVNWTWHTVTLDDRSCCCFYHKIMLSVLSTCHSLCKLSQVCLFSCSNLLVMFFNFLLYDLSCQSWDIYNLRSSWQCQYLRD